MPSPSSIKQETDPTLLGHQRTMTVASAPSEAAAGYTSHHRKFANPAPLGLASFAATTFLLSLFNIQVRGIKTDNLIVSMAFGYGGLVQLLAGMWEFASGNTFGATAFSSYGGFWISFGLISYPSSGVLAAYEGSKTELENALALYLMSWFIFTTIMFLGSLRSSVAMVALFFLLDVTFLLLAVGKFYPGVHALTKAGGVFGVITAFVAWYVAAAGLLASEGSLIRLPLGDLSRDKQKQKD